MHVCCNNGGDADVNKEGNYTVYVDGIEYAEKKAAILRRMKKKSRVMSS